MACGAISEIFYLAQVVGLSCAYACMDQLGCGSHGLNKTSSHCIVGSFWRRVLLVREETTRTRNVTGLPTRCMAAEPWKRVNVKTIHGKEFANHPAGWANLESMAAKAGCTTIPVSTKAWALDRLR